MSNQKYIRTKALVVGIDHYLLPNQLDNVVGKISVNSNKPNYVGRIKFPKNYSFDVALG